LLYFFRKCRGEGDTTHKILHNMKTKLEKEKIELKKRLARILRVPANKICADCPEKRPTWISFIKPQQNFALGSKVLASFVCLECAGLHRKLGTQVCVVRSISHDQFEKKDVECAEYSGNEVVNEILEGHLQKSTMDGINIKPLVGAEIARRERFIRQKYVDLYFYRKRAHYQHLAEVNKTITNSRKPYKSSDSKSSPTKPARKKLNVINHDETSATSEKDGKTSGCSITVGNTTMTPTNTSRTRTIGDQDHSNRSDNVKSRAKKKSKKRSSKSTATSTNRKKGQKKSSSKRQLKSKEQVDPVRGISSNRLSKGDRSNEEKSAPQKQPNIRNNLKLIVPETAGTSKRNRRDFDDLSGMILIFDEETCETFESPKPDRRKSSKDLNRGSHSSLINAKSSKKHSVHSSNIQIDKFKKFDKEPLVKSTSECCDSRDTLATSLRDVRRSQNVITIHQITKNRCGSKSPGFVGKQNDNQSVNIGPSLRVGRNETDRCSPAEKLSDSMSKNDSLRKLNIKLPLQGDTSQLKAHLIKDRRRKQNSSAKNLTIPYLESIPTSPVSVEGIVSEETSYGFGENTINNMSGTGENNQASIVGDNSTMDGFRVINVATVRECSNSCSNIPLESRGNFSLPFKNKKEINDAIKNQHGRRPRCSVDNESKLSLTDDVFDSLNQVEDYQNGMSKSHRSISNSSNLSMSNKSIKDISNKCNTSVGIDETILRIHPRQLKNQENVPSDSLLSNKTRSSKRRSKKSRSKGSKSERKLNQRNQALLDEWERLRSENQKKFIEFDQSLSCFHASF